MTFETRRLKQAGIDVTTVTFGCWELGGGPWEFTSDQNNLAILRKAYEHGITSFDTAEGYGNGHSEEIVGAALAEVRQHCVIATKVGRSHLAPADVRTSAEASLKRLRTDYIDILYIHWPSYDVPVAETLGEFLKLKQEGKIRAIGASNFSIEQLREACQTAPIDVIQPEYSLLHRGIEPEIVPYCLEHGIGIMSYSSIAKGILTGAFHLQGHTLKEDDFRLKRRLFQPDHLAAAAPLLDTMRTLAEGKGCSVSQVAIAWLLHKPGMTSAIVGTQSEKHLADNIGGSQIALSQDEMQALDAVSDRALDVIGY